MVEAKIVFIVSNVIGSTFYFLHQLVIEISFSRIDRLILNSFEVLPKSPFGERISTAQRSANTSPSACPRTIYVLTFSSIIYFQRDTGDTIVHLSLHDLIFEKIVLCLTKNWRG